ncbi:hypothetical protein V8C86DRAFT_2609146 [Haematococcus lacustris]
MQPDDQSWSRMQGVDGAEFVTAAEQGFSGLLGRIVEVPQATFKHEVERAVGQKLAAELDAGTRWHSAPKSIWGLPLISPTGTFTLIWMSLIFAMDITYTAFWVPLNVAFCSTSYGNLSTGCARADLAGGVVYALHLLINFQVGVVLVHGYRKRVIMDGMSVAKLYMKYGRFWLDFLTALPFVYLVVILAAKIEPTRWVAIASLFRLVRMTRLIALGNVLFMDAQRGEDSSRVIKALGGSTAAYVYIVGFAVLCVVNLEACLLVLVAEFNGVENSWMMSYNWVNIADSSEPYQWYSAVYAAIASNTNTGLAGMKWLSYQEFGVCMLMQLVGMVMLTMVLTVGISSITRLTGTARRAHLLTLKLKRVRAWLRCQQLPDRMSKHIMSFYYEVWVKQARPVCEDAVVADMPHFLRGSLLLPMTLHLVERVHYFSECDPLLRSLLAQSLVPIEVMGGVELCEEGHEPDCCWLLESGTLMALNTKGQQYILTAPCLIGECVILRQAVPACSKRLWSYRTLMADEEAVPCKLWRLQARDITVLSSCYPALVTGLLKYLQGKLVYKLCRSSCALHAFPGADAAWCELADRVAPSLLALPESIQDSTRAQLGKAGVEDGSLLLLLDALVEVAVLNPRDALALSGALAHPDKVLATRTGMAARKAVELAVALERAGHAAQTPSGRATPHTSGLHEARPTRDACDTPCLTPAAAWTPLDASQAGQAGQATADELGDPGYEAAGGQHACLDAWLAAVAHTLPACSESGALQQCQLCHAPACAACGQACGGYEGSQGGSRPAALHTSPGQAMGEPTVSRDPGQAAA